MYCTDLNPHLHQMKRTKLLKAVADENPCLHCGACCACYRVSFYWGEAEPCLGGKVPVELTEDLTDFRRCMRGTNQRRPRCIALKGELGKSVKCAIYTRRPTVCRLAGVTYKRGVLRTNAEELERCNRARAAWGLPPLSLPAPDTVVSESSHPTGRA